MISIVWQGDRRYNVYRNGQDIGCVAVYCYECPEPYCSLQLGLDEYDPAMAKELFSLLRRELGRPLQYTKVSDQKLQDFLTAGGFQRKRRSYEIDVSSADLAAPVCPAVALHAAEKGSALYDACCKQLYHDCRARQAAAKLPAEYLDDFYAGLPETLFCALTDGSPIHYAFVTAEDFGCTVGSVGSGDLSTFIPFAQSLLYELFQKYPRLMAECADDDPAAMQLMGLFNIPLDWSVDAYVLE